MKFTVLLFLWCLSAMVLGQDKIVTYRGDTITCQIERFDADTYYFSFKKDDHTLHTSIEKEKVEHIIYKKLLILENENDSASSYILHLKDGSVLYGEIRNIGSDYIEFGTPSLGVVKIYAYEIEASENLNRQRIKGGTYWAPNPHATRHFFGPTAINLEQGEGYLQDIYVLLVSANYGLTNNFSVGAAVTIIPGISLGEQLYMLTPKFGFPLGEKFNLGGGFLLVHVTDWNMGILYAAGTYGTIERNLTLGFGYGMYDEPIAKPPILMIGGMYRISRRMSLVTENWALKTRWYDYNEITYQDEYYYENSLAVSYGIRFFGEQLSVDFAFLNLFSKSSEMLFFPGIPYLDFVIKF